MELSLHILAVLGFAAALVRWLRSAVSALERGIEAFHARQVAETRARRGDVTGTEEAAGAAARARRARRRFVGEFAFWTALLAWPAWLVESPAPVYAAYAVLWFLPRPGGGRGAQPAQDRG